MVIFALVQISLVSALGCDNLTRKIINTYAVSDFSTLSFSSLNSALITKEYDWKPVDGSYFIWYDSPDLHPDEIIRFDKKFTVIGRILKSDLNIIYDDTLSIIINNQDIAIPGTNSYYLEKNIDITNSLKTGENLASFYVWNYRDSIGSLRFRITIQQEIFV